MSFLQIYQIVLYVWITADTKLDLKNTILFLSITDPYTLEKACLPLNQIQKSQIKNEVIALLIYLIYRWTYNLNVLKIMQYYGILTILQICATYVLATDSAL